MEQPEPEQVVILDGTGYAIKRGKKFELFEPEAKSTEYAYGSSVVVATASVETILELLASTRRIRRKRSTYSGSVSVDEATLALQALFEPWGSGQKLGYLSYSITIDANDLPTKMKIVWRFPTVRGFYDSMFETKYSDWRTSAPIPTPR